jgi:alpha-methylacyl-CoA racemase
MTPRPLDGIRIIDLTTLLPGPMATLILAEAGAEVIKVERPGGDEMRSYGPKWGGEGINFALLNRGKSGLVLDLKDPAGRERLLELVRDGHVLIEQFRPGVMERLGLGWEVMRRANPRLVYCALTGYGQTGPKAQTAGHDLNYMADAGLLALSAGADGAPVLPPVLVGDIGGGTLPAALNIILALRQVELTGEGCFLDVAMCDNLMAWGYAAIGKAAAGGLRTQAGGEMFTGGSPRYQIYRTADDRFLAAAPLEPKFWARFCELIGLDAAFRDDSIDPAATAGAVAAIISQAPASHWETLFGGEDVCCNLVRNMAAALQDPHFKARGLFEARVAGPAGELPALPVPLAPALRSGSGSLGYPSLTDAQGTGQGRSP